MSATSPSTLPAFGVVPAASANETPEALRQRLAAAEALAAEATARHARLVAEREQLAQAEGDPYGFIAARRIAVGADIAAAAYGLQLARQRIAVLRERLGQG